MTDSEVAFALVFSCFAHAKLCILNVRVMDRLAVNAVSLFLCRHKIAACLLH